MNNKKILTSMAAALMSAAALAQVPAFPGAEGHGRYVTGGRGGKVIHVTNLHDKGTGSFRAAVTGNSKKIIVFDVAGVIPLASDLTIGANTTILGQTAPSPGITLRYYTVRPEDNCIIRFIRLRRGQEKDINDGADATQEHHLITLGNTLRAESIAQKRRRNPPHSKRRRRFSCGLYFCKKSRANTWNKNVSAVADCRRV